jgi:uncharacterized repeat protein (TIGR03803 family)
MTRGTLIRLAGTLVFSVLLLMGNSIAQSVTVLHAFTGGSDGVAPLSGVVFDSLGNLYGTTFSGGSTTACGGDGCGAVYELTPAVGGIWQETILFSFANSGSGGAPTGNLLLDGNGNIFGTDVLGGTNIECSDNTGGLFGCGLVFELSPSSAGWQESIPFVLNSARMGEVPEGGVTADTAGNLYGVTSLGGNLSDCGGVGCGTVFRLSPTVSGGWQPSLLHTFMGGKDGSAPRDSSLALDASGNVYGTTVSGGNAACSCGVVFELSPLAGGGWKETVIHAFSGLDGANPTAGLTFDAAGNLFGTTLGGGNLSLCNGFGCGVAFELSPKATGGWGEIVLHQFGSGNDGSTPQSSLSIDETGNLYGTTSGGGVKGVHCSQGCGIVYKLSLTSGGWKEAVLHRFTGGTDGAMPVAQVTLDAAGNIFGTTESGGNLADCNSNGCGVVFEIVQ